MVQRQTSAAAKRKKLFFLAAVCALCSALLAPTPALATRTLPDSSGSTLAPQLPQLEQLGADRDAGDGLALIGPEDRLVFATLTLLDHDQVDAVVARQRHELHLLSADLARAREAARALKTATGVSTSLRADKHLEWRDLRPESHRQSYQGLWTDPTTGLSYARNRWYDARTASWLSEDPLGPVDSPNLYAFVAWGPHRYVDPMGLDHADVEYALQRSKQRREAEEAEALRKFEAAKQQALQALAQAAIAGEDRDPIEQRRFLFDYAMNELGMDRERASAFNTLVLGPLQSWELKGKPWTRDMVLMARDLQEVAEFIETRGYLYVNLAIMAFSVPGTGPSSPAITLQEKAAKGALRIEITGGAAEGLAPLGPRSAVGRSGGIIYEGESFASGVASGTDAITPFYPPNAGFIGGTSRVFLRPGEMIDRFGGSGYSRFFSPVGTPEGARALPPGTTGQPLRTFEVLKPIEVEAGTVAPYYGQPGFGMQYRTPVNLKTLLDRGIIREVHN